MLFPGHAKLHTLEVGAHFRVVGLEQDGVHELIRLTMGSAYVRSTSTTLREFETRGGDLKRFQVPSGGFHVSRETLVKEVK